MPGPVALTDRSLAQRWREVKAGEEWFDDMHEVMTETVKELLEEALDRELLEQLQAGWYSRNPDRVDWRNGYRTRSLQTRLGVIKDLRVPRSRRGTYQSKILPRYDRYADSVQSLVCETFLAGVSTRRVGEVMEPLLGGTVSASTVSHMTKVLDAAVRAFHQGRLGDDVRYLFLDGVVLRVKGAAKVQRKAVLTAYGIKESGEKELIAFRMAASEASVHWEGFLNNLYQRGLEGKGLQLIITDGGKGLHQALTLVYGQVRHQRCWVHKLRNVMGRLPAKWRVGCLKQLRTVYIVDTEAEAKKRYREWADKWRTLAAKAVECVEPDIDSLLSFLHEPKELASRLRTTNAIERCFREVRRRTRPMSCFNNDASCERIMLAVFRYQNGRWKGHPIPHFTHNT